MWFGLVCCQFNQDSFPFIIRCMRIWRGNVAQSTDCLELKMRPLLPPEIRVCSDVELGCTR